MKKYLLFFLTINLCIMEDVLLAQKNEDDNLLCMGIWVYNRDYYPVKGADLETCVMARLTFIYKLHDSNEYLGDQEFYIFNKDRTFSCNQYNNGKLQSENGKWELKDRILKLTYLNQQSWKDEGIILIKEKEFQIW